MISIGALSPWDSSKCKFRQFLPGKAHRQKLMVRQKSSRKSKSFAFSRRDGVLVINTFLIIKSLAPLKLCVTVKPKADRVGVFLGTSIITPMDHRCSSPISIAGSLLCTANLYSGFYYGVRGGKLLVDVCCCIKRYTLIFG